MNNILDFMRFILIGIIKIIGLFFAWPLAVIRLLDEDFDSALLLVGGVALEFVWLFFLVWTITGGSE